MIQIYTDEPPSLPLAPSNGTKHRSYAFGVTSSGLNGTGTSTGIGTRPRRSASLSDAGGEFSSFLYFILYIALKMRLCGSCMHASRTRSNQKKILLYFYSILFLIHP
jgi:hypothetical protein